MKINKKRILLVILALSLLLPYTVSCYDTTIETDPNTSSGGIEQYRIVYQRTVDISKAATKLRNEINDRTSITPECTSDTSAAPVEREILIGNTGRAESTDFISSLEPYSYGVRVNGTKVVIAAHNDDYITSAVDLFIKEYLPKKGSSEILLKTEETIMTNEKDKQLDELAAAQKIQWQDSSSFVQSGGYARMTTLPDGKLACVYSGGGYIRFCTSNDDGKSWNAPVNVIKIDKTPTDQSMTLANANIVVMKDGSYMVAFRAHTAGNDFSVFYTSIRYCISRDNGQTWSEDVIVAENTHQGKEFTGFWEPHMLYIKDGRLAMYYAADCIGGTAEGYPFVSDMVYQHIILHIYDEQTEKFGEPIIASNGEKHNSRDGMPVICKLADDSYAMVIESSSMKDKYPFIVQILFSEDGITWSDPKNIWVPNGNDHYAGAPYIVTLPDGRIAVSFQATEGSGTTIANNKVNNSVMNVIISSKPIGYKDKDDISQSDFERIMFNPIDTELKNAYAVWPAMHVHNGNLYCTADLGVATSATGRSAKGIYLRIGTIK